MLKCWRGSWYTRSRATSVLAVPRYIPSTTWPKPSRSYATAAAAHNSRHRKRYPGSLAEYKVFKRFEPPEGRRSLPSQWAPLIEACLPPHLRRLEYAHSGKTIEDAWEKGEVLLAAQQSVTATNNVDLLLDLGINQGRWKAVIALVKDIVDHIGPATQQDSAGLPGDVLWKNVNLLDAATDGPISLEVTTRPISITQPRLDWPHNFVSEQTDDDSAASTPTASDTLRRNVLGVIWRSLGSMIISCADNAVQPEILEIIAYLHHQGMMPASIYSRKPREDETAIQQPPTLHLLSSRILTSLSDAAWRAHENVLVEEARAKGGKYIALKPEVPGSAYRVHVAGLRPEIWLELVLWSCLHGGWILEGAAILEAVHRQRSPEWKPISWRSLVPAGSGRLDDWDKLDYIFNTQAPETIDQDPVVHEVRRTVSSEVVNAYVDALLCELDAPVRDQAVSEGHVLRQLNRMRSFLERSSLKLGGGSWDAVVLRFFESRPNVASSVPLFEQLISLSPGFGGEVTSSNTQKLPAYVLDASAATIGIAHHALRSQVKSGNVHAALHVLQALRAYTDANKLGSLESFLGHTRLGSSTRPQPGGLFTSNYSAIDYPAFDVQIPSDILASLLDLATDTRAHEIGIWLLYNDELDGPVIPESMYSNVAITPALVRFATATNDKNLLSKVIRGVTLRNRDVGEGPMLPQAVLRAFLDTQITYRHWHAARRLLEALAADTLPSWNLVNVRVMACEMLALHYSAKIGLGDSEEDIVQVKDIFTAMMKGEYGNTNTRDARHPQQLTTLLLILSAIDPCWSTFCNSVRPLRGHYTFELDAKHFNPIMEAVLHAEGAEAGRRLLDIFWSPSVRAASNRGRADRSYDTSNPLLESVDRQRSVLPVSGADGQPIVLYGGLRPDIMTVRVILDRAVKEWKQRSGPANDEIGTVQYSRLTVASSQDTAIWAARRLHELGLPEDVVGGEMSEALSGDRVSGLRRLVSDALKTAEDMEGYDGGRER